MAKFLLMLAVILSINYTIPAQAADKEPLECFTKTYEQIITQNTKHAHEFHKITDKSVQIYVDFVNAERARQNMGPMEADMVLIAELKDGYIGMAMFKDNCLVPGTFTKDGLEGVQSWFITSGVSEWLELFDVKRLEEDRKKDGKGA